MRPLIALLCAVVGVPAAARARDVNLESALEIALRQDYGLRQRRLQVDTAKAQIDEVWSAVYPRVDAAVSYTRKIKAPNPFAGSDVSQLFSQGGQGGPSFDSDAFLVPNAFVANLSVTQTLYSGAAFEAIKGADAVEGRARAAEHRRAHEVIDAVSRAYYGTLLARARAKVIERSVFRARETLAELTRRVEQGVAPTFQKLGAEVEVANLETLALQSHNGAAQALDALKLAIGLAAGEPLEIQGELAPPQGGEPTLAAALEQAMARRPDLRELRLALQSLDVRRKIERTGYLPEVSAFLNAGYLGNVPDDRVSTTLDPAGGPPVERDEDFFSGSYWQPNVEAGVRLNWNLFDGFGTGARIRQTQADAVLSEVQLEQLREAVRLEVSATHRDLTSAAAQLASQARVVEQAELNYSHAKARVKEGVSSPLELREASGQLDQSRLNRLQATHDLLVARLRFLVAMGTPPGLNTPSEAP